MGQPPIDTSQPDGGNGGLRIVVSHAGTDCVRARRVAVALTRLGHDATAGRCLVGGGGHRPHHPADTGRADLVVVLWTLGSIRCPWVHDEACAARTNGTLRSVCFRVPPPRRFRTGVVPVLPLLADGTAVASALGLAGGRYGDTVAGSRAA